MNGVDIVGELLLADTAITTAVPSERIKAGSLPLGTGLPAIGLMSISDVDRNALCSSEVGRVTERIQVTVAAENYDSKDAVLALVKRACASRIGAFAGLTEVTVHSIGKGPDMENEEASIFMQNRDFRVAYNEPT